MSVPAIGSTIGRATKSTHNGRKSRQFFLSVVKIGDRVSAVVSTVDRQPPAQVIFDNATHAGTQLYQFEDALVQSSSFTGG